VSVEPEEVSIHDVYRELVGEVAFILDAMATAQNAPPVILAAQFGASVMATINLNRSITVH
jgi:hypothetical protein